MATMLWAVYVNDPKGGADSLFAGPYHSLHEARIVARRMNHGRPQGAPLYYAAQSGGGGPTPAGRTDYPEDAAKNPVPWGWREERQPEQPE